MCGTCGDSPPDWYRDEVRRARKKYVCEECQKEITPGEKYFYAAGKDNIDGNIWSLRLCLACQEDWDLLHRLVEQKQEDTGNYSYEVEEHIGDLDEAVQEALERGILEATHRLVKKWLPKT